MIHQLSANVVNQIAAGEVIERPASVVKELLENSVDAQSTRINVTVEQGGADLVRVSDDGCGIGGEELLMAVASHATSKIRDADDLFRIGTLGFRGEALASIAAVAQVRLSSRTPDGDSGFELSIAGGDAARPRPYGCPPGTTLEVRNLFYNTPVRKKFLRTIQTELGHCTEAVTRVALAHPDIHFTLQHGERLVLDLPPEETWRERIARLFGNQLADTLIWAESCEGDVQLKGYVADPSQSRANSRMQYLLVNGRYIRDRSLQHALVQAYRGLLMTGRYPIAFLRLHISPELVDVNVHPTKLEVRFQDGNRIYSQVLSALRTKFLSMDLTASMEGGTSPQQSRAGAGVDPRRAAQGRDDLVRWARGELPEPAMDRPFVTGSNRPAVDPQRRLGLVPPAPTDANFPSVVPGPGVPTGPEDMGPGNRQTAAELPRGALQVHNCYLITETDDGVIVIDQHALHERILYERLREKVLAKAVETQALLVPEPVSLRPAEAAAVLDAQQLLAEMGIQIQPFGGDTVLVSGYPAILAKINPAELLREIVELLLSGDRLPERRDCLDQLLHMVSCKAAVKSGDRLSPEEVTALIEQRNLVQDSHHCPHGRPTSLMFTRQELDRRFGRI